MMLVAVQEETASGRALYKTALEFFTERITVRDVVREYARQEVLRRNRSSGTGPETAREPVAVEKQIQNAIDGFDRHSYFLLIDQRQAESLDEELWLGPETQIRFVRLTPLIGG